MSFAHTFRLECDSARPAQIVDQTTGVPMALTRGETIRIKVALFQAGVLVPKINIISIIAKLVDSGGVVRTEWNNSGTSIIDLTSVGSWRRGHDYLTAFDLTEAQSTALAAGTYHFIVQGLLVEGPSGGSVFFANLLVDLMNPPTGALPSSPPTPGPPTSWTKGESDARYAAKSEEASLDSTQDALADLAEWIGYAPGVPINFVSAGAVQGFTAAEKAQGRANIGAALGEATVQTSDASYTPTPSIHSRWILVPTADMTFANAANINEWVLGKVYEIIIAQDATGNRKITWGNSYFFPRYAAVDPQPSGVTRLFARLETANVRVWEAEAVETPFPDLMFHAGRCVTADASDVITFWNDPINATAMPGTTPSPITRVTTFNGGRPAASLTGAKDLRFTGPYKGSVGAGCTVALVFDSSSSASPQYLACLAYLGVEVGYNVSNGLFIAAVGAASGNRVALPFPGLAANTPCIFIGTIRGSGGGMALDHLGVSAYNSAGGMAAPVRGTTEHVWSLGGASFWNGKGNQILAWSRALSWPEMVAVRRALSLEIGI